MRIFFVITLVCICSTGCVNQPISRKTIDKTVYAKIAMLCPDIRSKVVNIYYFDGDCSICISKAMDLENEFRGNAMEKVLYIATTQNEYAARFNIENIGIKSCYIISDSAEYNSFFSLNTITKIDKNLKIIEERKY